MILSTNYLEDSFIDVVNRLSYEKYFYVVDTSPPVRLKLNEHFIYNDNSYLFYNWISAYDFDKTKRKWVSCFYNKDILRKRLVSKLLMLRKKIEESGRELLDLDAVHEEVKNRRGEDYA